jgi:hypothetical protein
MARYWNDLAEKNLYTPGFAYTYLHPLAVPWLDQSMH